METFKTIGLWIGIFIAISAAATFFLPSKVYMEKSIIIKSSPSEVYKMVNDHKGFTEWLPLFLTDSTIRHFYKGGRAGVGSQMVWESDNEEVGWGKQWIVESRRDKYVQHKLEFGVEGTYTTEFILEAIRASSMTYHTKVTWSYTGDITGTGLKNVIMSRFFGAFFIDSMIGEEYEQGLLSLKKVVESAPPVDELREIGRRLQVSSHGAMYH